ncbi:hypothetical protein K0U00_33200, partial [Paenibacillus sepulcri]|nr:hypothetical protein [Paenibacillus sepulcri]
MKLSAFLADRWGYMFLYVLNTGLMVLVVDLDFLELGVSLRTGNIIYIFVLSFALLALFLTIDYLRQRPYYRRMLAISQEHESIEQILNLQDGATREQRAMEQLVLDNYGQYASRLAAY